MTRTAALLAPLLLAACLAPAAPGLTAAERSDILRYAPGADLSHLSREQELALSAALHDGDGLDLSREIASILMMQP